MRLLLSIALIFLLVAPATASNAPVGPRQILVLDSFHPGLPIPESIDRGIFAALLEGGFSAGDIFMEHLDFARAPSREHRTNLVNLLRHKLADKSIGVVITIGAPATEFLGREGIGLFPATPILKLISPNDHASPGSAKVMSIPWRVDPAATLRVALDLFPRTQRVLVVTGARDDILPFLDVAKTAFAPWQDKLEFEYTDQLTYAQMLERTRSLPPESLVIYSPYFTDSTGRSFVPAEVVREVCRVASVPVFATLEEYLGSGIVGGALLRTEDIGKQAGKVALDYLQGRLQLVEPLTTFETSTLMEFDWQVLTRWGKTRAEFPRESLFIHRPPTLWGQYRLQVLATAVFVLVLSALVLALMLLNRRLQRSKDAVSDSEARFRAMMNYAPEAIIILNTDSQRVVDANAKAEQLFDCPREPLLQGGLDRFYPQPQPDGKVIAETMAQHSGLALQGEEVVFERLVRSAAGRNRLCEVRVTQLPYEGLRLLRASFIDISDRKRAEAEKANFEAQLQQAQKIESVGRLAGGVAHDFNNMLSVILGHADLALMKTDSKQAVYAHLQEIRKAAERSADLTRQLLAFARKQTIAPKVLDLNQTVAGMFQMLQRLIGEDIDLLWQPGAQLWPVKMDPSQIDQVLANLCVNARDAITGVGKITIGTGTSSIDAQYAAQHPEVLPGEYVTLTVSDNGSGMDKATLAHIFEPFFTTKEVGKGTGLGLATVFGAVKQNGGFINVYSEPGWGTNFTIYLPRQRGSSEQGPAADPVPTTPGSRETILLVEDEPSLLQMTATMLAGLGYTVLQANTPSEAVEVAAAHPEQIHLLITDVIMPQRNGRDLANQLQSLWPHLKCLFISGYTAEVIAHHGVLDEDVHFLQKPFTLPELATKVRDVLDR